MEEKYIPKVGDKVRIKKGHSNWATGMDKYVGQEIEIESIQANGRGGHYLKLKGIPFAWHYDHGHYEPIINTDPTSLFRFC